MNTNSNTINSIQNTIMSNAKLKNEEEQLFNYQINDK